MFILLVIAHLSPVHAANAEATQLSSCVASSVCISFYAADMALFTKTLYGKRMLQVRNWVNSGSDTLDP